MSTAFPQGTHPEKRKQKVNFEDELSRSEFSLMLFDWTSVRQLKQILSKMVALKPEYMRLVHKNLELKDPNRTLWDYRVKARSIIDIKKSHRLEETLGVIESYQIFR